MSQTYLNVSQFWLALHLIPSHFWSLLLFAGSCCPSAPGAGPVPRHRRSTGGPERTRQAVGGPDLRGRVHQHGGHRDTRTFGGERHPVSGQAACLCHVLSCNPLSWGKSGWFVSCSFGEMLAFTLTGFLELMDHGIVSWDLISLSFIKQVPPQPQGSFIRTPQRVSLCRLPAEIHGQFFLSLYSSFMSFFRLDVSGCCCQATAHVMQTLLPVYEQLSLREKCCALKMMRSFKSRFTVCAWQTPPRLVLCPRSDRRLREPAHGGRVHPAALARHPGEHGAQQSQPVPPSGSGDHRGTAHRAPASVSTHTRTGASRTLMDGGADFLLLRQNQQCSNHQRSSVAHDWWID